VLTPPGLAQQLLDRTVRAVASYYNRNQRDPSDLDIEVVTTTHVPPYGNGTTHGWTKIIRFVPQPLLLQVTDALHGILVENVESFRLISMEDIRAALRQVLYFHCRINQAATQTALLSLRMDDVFREPLESAKQIHEFLTTSSSVHAGGIVWDDHEMPNDDDQELIFEKMQSWGSLLLTQLEASYGIDMHDALDKVLLEEFQKTQNFSSLLCPSFWRAGESDKPLRMSLFTLRLAHQMSPHCSDSKDDYAVCIVERDWCESNGDPICEISTG
jgi:hypothetical protein